MPPAVQDYQTVYNSLDPVYAPQTQLVQQQQAALQPAQEADLSALDQAKINAFKSIDNSANAKGMLFSGFSPDQQAQYVGTKYLPAVAKTKQAYQNQGFALQDQLNKIQGARSTQAQGTVAAQQKAYNDYLQQQRDDYYKQAQLGLSYARLNASSSKGSQLTPYEQYQIGRNSDADLQKVLGQYKKDYKDSAGNYKFTGPNGSTNMYQYAAATALGDPNQTYQNMKELLKNGSQTDKGTYNYVLYAEKQGQTPAQIMAGLKKNNPYYF